VANKTAPALVLMDGDRERLESVLRSTTVPAGLAQRARVVLLASDGVANYEIADRVGVSRPTVNLWRGRYAERGLAVWLMRSGLVGRGRWIGRR
jgi:FixJ family two-component response regulator